MSVTHTKAVACPDCFWAHQPCLNESATWPSYVSFSSKRHIYLEPNHRLYFNMCMVESWEEELYQPEVQNRNCVRLFQLHPCRQRPWGGGAARAATMKVERPLTHLSLALCLLWALGPALALHFPEFWYLYFPLNTWKPLSNTSEWNFPMEHVINLVPSAKVSCHSSNINVREPWILPLYFYRIFIVWCLPSCPGGTV